MAPRGRPAFKPTAAQRQRVEQLISCSMSKEAIARVIGIETETLRKHFADELQHGIERKRAEVIGLLYRSAKGGNLGAQKKLEELTRIAAAALEIVGHPPVEAPVATPKRGKKEEVNAAAEQVAADGIFAVPQAPKLIVNNR